MNNKLKIIFFGSSYFSLSILENICKFNKFLFLYIITKDNNLKINKNNYINLIKLFSIKNGINILQSRNLNENIINIIKKSNPDLIIIASYGNLIPNSIINIPKFGCINIHCSILPKWKGPFPIYWQIISGEKESGITIIKINSKLDSGNIIFQKKCKISEKENYVSLEKKLIDISCESIIYLLHKYINNEKINEIKQINNNNYEYARKINKKIDTKINWNLSSINIDRCIRANYIYGSYFYYENIYIKLWEAEILTTKKNLYKIGEILYIDKDGMGVNTKEGIIQIKVIQFPSKKKIDIKNYINSNNIIFKIGNLLN
ncbi:methionyl-tRNA formyltransferase [endosymbiont of Pachyrhynchus infernalis]|uniref:methionyl-tRNA formyltransferase n=1 Tax=endosymbiont of Pachyrhynchus infernalis TaxID=1971488 RepID=UPI000DC6D913|nr:methionyl-tRNA formyltransferase [endosymbiont of Pachyrhynchus infernalis]BBA84858.1 methionyl-tRNA formyltransferase [endosymbiont of Pachyrhynchus infernalis]